MPSVTAAIDLAANDAVSVIPKQVNPLPSKLNSYSTGKALKCIFQITAKPTKKIIELALKTVLSVKQNAITGATYSDLSKALALKALKAGHIVICANADITTLRSKDIIVVWNYVSTE